MEAGCNDSIRFLRSKKRTAQKRQGGRFWKGESLRLSPAQGIAAEIPEASPKAKLRNWSGKPGFRRSAPEMRPNS
jgi:hypothetical protein